MYVFDKTKFEGGEGGRQLRERKREEGIVAEMCEYRLPDDIFGCSKFTKVHVHETKRGIYVVSATNK